MAGHPQGLQFSCARDALDVAVEARNRTPTDVHLAAADRILDGGVVGVEIGNLVRGAVGDQLQIPLDACFDVLDADHGATLHGHSQRSGQFGDPGHR